MKPTSGREFARIIEGAAGRCSASAAVIIYGKPESTVRLSVPIHGNHALKRGLLRHLMKLAEIDDADLAKQSAQPG